MSTSSIFISTAQVTSRNTSSSTSDSSQEIDSGNLLLFDNDGIGNELYFDNDGTGKALYEETV